MANARDKTLTEGENKSGSMGQRKLTLHPVQPQPNLLGRRALQTRGRKVHAASSRSSSWQIGRMILILSANLRESVEFRFWLERNPWSGSFLNLSIYLSTSSRQFFLQDKFSNLDKLIQKMKNKRRIVGLASLLPGEQIIVSDFLSWIMDGHWNIAIPLWKSEILKKFGPVLLCSTGSGHMGEMMFIDL